jgi:amino acid transporter
MGTMLGAARLLYGMGRSGALPPRFFGAVDARHRVPRNNVLFVGAVSFAGAFAMDFDLGAQMLNFGALIAFMGVNAAALSRYWLHAPRRTVGNFLVPAAGFAICLLLWLNLSRPAQIAGGAWMAAGIAFGAWKTRGFRGALMNFDFPVD